MQFGTASVWNGNSKCRGLCASHGFSIVSAEGGYGFLLINTYCGSEQHLAGATFYIPGTEAVS